MVGIVYIVLMWALFFLSYMLLIFSYCASVFFLLMASFAKQMLLILMSNFSRLFFMNHALSLLTTTKTMKLISYIIFLKLYYFTSHTENWRPPGIHFLRGATSHRMCGHLLCSNYWKHSTFQTVFQFHLCHNSSIYIFIGLLRGPVLQPWSFSLLSYWYQQCWTLLEFCSPRKQGPLKISPTLLVLGS